MPEPCTPGQMCYETWRRKEPRGWLYERPLPWTQLDASTQAAWEAAAQAVLRQAQGTLIVDLDPDILRRTTPMPDHPTPGQGISLNHALFRQALARRVDRIKWLCKEWGVPRLATHVTLILRDPANDQMSFVLSDDPSLSEAYRIVQMLERERR